jgi:hypothetical protein
LSLAAPVSVYASAAIAQEEEADAALKEEWSKTPDAPPMKRAGEARDAQFLRFLTHHKLVPHDSTVETLRGLLEDETPENKERKKELLKELESIPSSEKDTETYDELRSYIRGTASEVSRARCQACGAIVGCISPPPRLPHGRMTSTRTLSGTRSRSPRRRRNRRRART